MDEGLLCMNPATSRSTAVDARIVLDRAGLVCESNAKAVRLLRRSAASLRGQALPQVLGAPPDTVLMQECAKALDAGRPVTFDSFAPHLERWIEVQARPLDPEHVELVLRDVSARKAATQPLREGEERYRHLVRAMADAVWDWDLQARTVWWSDGAQRLMGTQARAWLAGGSEWLADVHPDDSARVRTLLEAAMEGEGDTWTDDFRLQRHDGETLSVSCRAYMIRDDAGAVRRIVGGLSDVTLRLQAERELQRLTRAQRMLSACNEALIRAESEASLLRGVCQASVDIGGYAMAWVGYAHHDADKTIELIAHAGDDPDFMQGIAMSWDAQGPHGQGPAARAVRSGRVVIVEDIAKDPSFAPWLSDAQRAGFRGVACLPLWDRLRTFGFFYLYAPEVVQIGRDEIVLLQELANNLAFGIGNLRSQQQQRRLHAAVQQVAVAVSAVSGDTFFRKMVDHMALAVGARAAFIGRLGADGHATIRSLASVVDGQFRDSAEYPFLNTPAEALLDAPSCYTETLPAPSQAMARALGNVRVAAYAGVRLEDSSGTLLGMLATMFEARPPDVEMVLSTMQIFATRVAAEIEREEQDRRLRRQASLLDLAQDAIVVYDADLQVQFWSEGAVRMYGWRRADVSGGFHVTRLHADAQAFEQALQEVRARGEWSGELVQHRRDGSTLTVGARWTLVREGAGMNESVLAIHTDITERKQAEREIKQLAFYDPLTKLPNRLLLMDRLQCALTAEHRSGRGGALMFIDLDNFKTLNDTLGHGTGDLLLQQVAARLRESVREVDTVARLGGDEFVVLLEGLGQDAQDVAHHARQIGEKILAALNVPFELDGGEHLSTCSIGVAPFHRDSGGVGELLKQADIAMYQAKALGRNTLRFFDPGLQAAVTARAALEADLRAALAQDELSIVYQPQVDADGRVTAMEALVRWQHPERGPIAPSEFIPIAEDTGLVLPLGRWVLRQACFQLARWAQDPNTAHLGMSVNVSPRQFRHPDFVAQCVSVLKRTRANGRRLKFELTEGVLIDDVEATAAKMAALREHGVGFALDDFGTGYSSLAYLRRLPLDQLKIDQSFVQALGRDANDDAIVRTIIGLAKSLGLQVMAEGVETVAQRDFLLREGCHDFQGFLFSRPLSPQDLSDYLEVAPASAATSTRQS
jgi:diguanylate cyclase (GGDEF)-like protein/PAS domain S-box-containing protein